MRWVVKATLSSGKVYEEYEDGSHMLNGKRLDPDEVMLCKADLKKGNFFSLILRDVSK
ncbi:hypothetical protein P4H32_32545 [Bacillus cereus]|nr:hypothetical protein [Bacillus cereus]